MLQIILYLAIGFLVGLVLNLILGKIPYLKDLFSNSSKASFGRIGAFIALVASIVWVSWVVYHTNVIPDLGGPSLFIGTLYGLSKAGDTAQAFSGIGQDQEKKP